MPKLTTSHPKYRKHRASGQAIVTLDGRDFYLGPHGSRASKLEFDRLILEYLANDRSLPREDQASLTVAQVLNKYRKFAERYYKKNGTPTSEAYAIKTIIRPIRQLYGTKPVAEFGPLALKAIRESWIQAGHARGTINKNVQRIVRMFRWAASEELIPVSIPQALATVEGLKRGRTEARETSPVLPIDLSTVETTMEHLCDVVRDMIRVQLLTGMRPAEVCSLRPIDIERSGDVWEYRPVGHKTEHHGRERTVYIGPEGQAILTPYLRRSEDAHCFSPREAVKQQQETQHAARVTPLHHGSRPGFCHAGLAGKKAKRPPGTRYTSDSYRRAIHRACDVAFPPDTPLEGDALKIWQSEHRWSPNRLRHTRGTEVRKQFGLEAAQVILGHSVANVTEIYAERDAEKARDVARKTG
ncbi:tyrosine-type recombinase/integrase [Planctomycetes bacterium TBK1r]|uniref:Site-specific tyrosine recombinase XerC n=1 Tax=Stieleria magnilauensis TaxID=2527963 RepID=A0ABX5Y0N7_9BACT|nr:site-specific tyrosine recombinase XerC [Planctomycetes bacterium TBK1r]